MVESPSRTLTFYSDGSYKLEDVQSILPPGYSYYQCGEDKQLTELWEGDFRGCSAGGCPGVVPLRSHPDTIFDEHWQFYVWAINEPMELSHKIALMGTSKAMFNNTGIPPRKNALTGNDGDGLWPRYDKFRTFVRNTHAGYDDGNYFYPLVMDGNNPPPMKPGKPRPGSVSEIVRSDYLYLPEDYRHLFVVCNNVKTKLGDVQSIFPFDNGARYTWTGDEEMYSFMPFASWFSPEELKTPLHWWNKVTSIQSPYRRVS